MSEHRETGSRRKRIGLFVSLPENIHVRRVLEGVRRGCERYDYDLCVFAASAHVSYPEMDYTRGETNIYELANFGELDGVILDTATLNGSREEFVQKRLLERLSGVPDLPVCCLEAGWENLPLIENDNEETLREMCRHLIEVHGKTHLCFLTGHKGHPVAEERLRVFLEETARHGITVAPEDIAYGDFWYTSGEALAEQIMKRPPEQRPEAAVCASDTMALGLLYGLEKQGVHVPEDFLIVGFDSTDEGATNSVTLSSYEPNDIRMGERAVDYIRSLAEPGAEYENAGPWPMGAFHPGASCGCLTDVSHTLVQIRGQLYNSAYNYRDDQEEGRSRGSVGALMESYVLERFTASATVDECMGHIYGSMELLRPFRNFYLCLKENWLDISDEQIDGYPEKMRIYVNHASSEEEQLCGEAGSQVFETAKMLPKLYEEREKPGVFYFLPVHFNGRLLGYTVLQKEIDDRDTPNVVNRTWLRFINNGLEMIRSKQRLETLSVRDEMTGLYNRRGMYQRFREISEHAQPGDALFVGVIDMDGLKYINDTFGHSDGDLGIKTVCRALQEVARPNEICVRSGGDEFFLIGIGTYTRDEEARRSREFGDAIAALSRKLDRPYRVSASIGCVVYGEPSAVDLDSALSEADERMYHYKFRNRRHRSV
ncbi:MAG: GGDEF domain-containing protein [Lachnospiraceae bacterium]|nr:GGDEF domain-containing protein [Lachnospiraceae bacterium]